MSGDQNLELQAGVAYLQTLIDNPPPVDGVVTISSTWAEGKCTGIRVTDAPERASFSKAVLERADRRWITWDGDLVTIHSTDGDYVYELDYFEDELRVIPATLISGPGTAAR